MPIIKSAKKQLKQSRVRQKRNYELRSQVKTAIKNLEKMCKGGELDKAKKKLVEAYKIIDTASKKNIIHKKNAARKKSKVARAVNDAEKKAATK